MRFPTVALAAGLLLLPAGLAGCGSQTKTVSVDEAAVPPASTATPPTATSTQAHPTTTTTTTPATSASGGTAAQSTTRTAPEPAFTETTSQAKGASAAAATVRAQGYTPSDTSEYHENQTLQVLVGTHTGSSDGYGQQAFFFLDGRYLGTDAKEPSATVRVIAQNDTEVVLAYPLYRPGDPLSSPSGGHAIVHFQLNNGKLTPAGRIPPASSSTGLSRN
jgi:hypothetical protein